MSQTEVTGERVCALVVGYEHPYTSRPYRRESAGKVGADARQALHAPTLESGRTALWTVDRPEWCVCAFTWMYYAAGSRPATIAASIFKRMSDAPDLDFNASQDFTAAYKVSI